MANEISQDLWNRLRGDPEGHYDPKRTMYEQLSPDDFVLSGPDRQRWERHVGMGDGKSLFVSD